MPSAFSRRLVSRDGPAGVAAISAGVGVVSAALDRPGPPGPGTPASAGFSDVADGWDGIGSGRPLLGTWTRRIVGRPGDRGQSGGSGGNSPIPLPGDKGRVE